jgi:hypothetical protein
MHIVKGALAVITVACFVLFALFGKYTAAGVIVLSGSPDTTPLGQDARTAETIAGWISAVVVYAVIASLLIFALVVGIRKVAEKVRGDGPVK